MFRELYVSEGDGRSLPARRRDSPTCPPSQEAGPSRRNRGVRGRRSPLWEAVWGGPESGVPS